MCAKDRAQGTYDRPVPGPQNHRRNYRLTWESMEGVPGFEKSVLPGHRSPRQQTLHTCGGRVGSRGPTAGWYRVPNSRDQAQKCDSSIFILFYYKIIPYGDVSLQITIAFAPKELVYQRNASGLHRCMMFIQMILCFLYCFTPRFSLYHQAPPVVHVVQDLSLLHDMPSTMVLICICNLQHVYAILWMQFLSFSMIYII